MLNVAAAIGEWHVELKHINAAVVGAVPGAQDGVVGIVDDPGGAADRQQATVTIGVGEHPIVVSTDGASRVGVGVAGGDFTHDEAAGAGAGEGDELQVDRLAVEVGAGVPPLGQGGRAQVLDRPVKGGGHPQVGGGAGKLAARQLDLVEGQAQPGGIRDLDHGGEDDGLLVALVGDGAGVDVDPRLVAGEAGGVGVVLGDGGGAEAQECRRPQGQKRSSAIVAHTLSRFSNRT